ncbi:MAG: SDR family oxidoreductase [Gemmobacter sp.]|jgi:nucleoside-diphosphate-sugar epimerase|nr:SDR family oxidoreductase [Gemmobacter sp.]
MGGQVLVTLGHGYSAAALARRLLPQGWRVIGATRDTAKAAHLAAEGVEPLLWPGDLAAKLAEASHVLLSMAPDAAGDPVLAAHRALFDRPLPGLRWLGYLSTTGVYGDHGGGWVDEDTPLTPGTERGWRRVAAEADWQVLAARHGHPLHIFRLAGIYGPGRGPFRKVQEGTARRVVKPGLYFSRIHVDDIGLVLEASIRRPAPGAVYNVCDDAPSPPQEVLCRVAELLGLPLPPEVPISDAAMTPLARSFHEESKRVRNDRMKAELGVRLAYPTYREGLAALMAEVRPTTPETP